MVQGRCVIRNESQNLLTRLVAVEFDIMYACSHQGRSRLSSSGIFGGSNGYWRRDVLQSILFDPEMLTEDIDASVRALLAGHRLVHDRSIISRELAPERWAHWFTQRKRWSQGWFEVSLTRFRAVMTSPALSIRQKFLWWYLLCWRECFPILSLQFFSLMLAATLAHHRIDWFASGLILATSILNLSCGVVLVVMTRICSSEGRPGGSTSWYLLYAVFGLVYTTVKTVVTMIAQLSQLLHEHNWIATPRIASGDSNTIDCAGQTASKSPRTDNEKAKSPESEATDHPPTVDSGDYDVLQSHIRT